jgi:preprotein translocase subunit SecB
VQDEKLSLACLACGAIITLRNVPQELLSAIVLVETPRLMFPFARNIIAATTRDGGFPPLMINPIDFGDLLRRNAAANPPGGAPVGGQPVGGAPVGSGSA